MNCAVTGCDKKARTRGLCVMHYSRLRRYGSTDPHGPGSIPALERFWQNVEKTETCWNWTGLGNRGGYGVIGKDGKRVLVHRLSYEIHRGPIPDGLQIDHLCRNRSCVNPDHLEPVTRKENILRGESPWAIRARQTHCVRGHELSGDNVFLTKLNQRRCRTCHRERMRKKEGVG